MTRFKEYYEMMVKDHSGLFDEFRQLHDKYVLEAEKWQKEFNELGEKVMEIVQEYENRLCKTQERGGYSSFTPKLAEKFRDEIRKNFAMFDHIGIEVTSPSSQSGAAMPAFELRKIRL